MSSMAPRCNKTQSDIMTSKMADIVNSAHQTTTRTSGISSSYTVKSTVTSFVSDMVTGYTPVHSESKIALKMDVNG